MRHTFVLVLPDRQGGLLEVERVLAAVGLSVSRANFNKVVDVHTVFIEVEGEEAQIHEAERALRDRGLLVDQAKIGSVQLVELELPDRQDSLLKVLELIDAYGFNITYLNARGTDDDPDAVLVGLYVEDKERLARFIDAAQDICPAKALAYDKNLEVVDNNLFYVSYARTIAGHFGLSADEQATIVVNMNRIVQNLEDTTADPYKPFDYLGRFAQTIDQHRGGEYARLCRVSRFTTAGGINVTSFEPPAGCTSWVFDLPSAGPDGRDEYFVVDSGYPCYRAEYQEALRREFPDWDERYHLLFLTHGDVDHAGAYDLFDEVLAVDDVIENFKLEREGRPDWREQNPLFLPYNRITNILTGYHAPELDRFKSLGGRRTDDEIDIARVLASDGSASFLDVGPLHFEVWQGAGGHVRGETVLIDREQRICVSGDIFINVHAQTKVQRDFNLISPYLMTSVDSVPNLARAERRHLFEMLDAGRWQILGGHGPLFTYERRGPSRPASA